MKFKRDIQQDKEECKELIFSICSDAPYERSSKEHGVYDEVLVISEDAIDWSRLKSGQCAFLKDHDMTEVLGVIQKAWIDGNKLKCKVKFSTSPEVQQIVSDIENGVRTATSIGYDILESHFEIVNNKKTLFATKYLIYEASSVGVPADISCGYNRSLNNEETNMNQQEEKVENIEETENKKSIEEENTKNEDAVDTEKADVEDATTSEENDDKSSDRTIEETDSEAKTDPPEEEKEEEETLEENEEENEEIRSLGDLTGFRSLAEKFISEKRSYDEFKKAIKNNNNRKELNVKGNNMKKFNLVKALRMNTSKFNGNVEDTEEYKIIQENKRNYNVNDADIVVTRKQLRAFPDGSETLNQTVYRPDLYTENLRPDSIIAKTGCRTVNVTGPSISFSVAERGVTAGFVDLNGEIPSADMSFALKTMTPKKVGAYVDIDYKALLQDDPSIENIITDDITKGLDQAKDSAIIVGDGTGNKPIGVVNTVGVNTVTAATIYSLSGVYAMEKLIRDSNDKSTNLTWVMNSKNYYKYATTPVSATAVNEFLIDKDSRKMIGYDVVICNDLTDTQVILGNFQELLCANYDGMQIKVVEDAKLSRKQAVEIQSFEAFDCLVRRPKSFTLSK